MKKLIKDILLNAFRILIILFFWRAIKSELALAKFSDLDTSQIRNDIVISSIPNQKDPIGQTFISRKPYLSSIVFFFDSHRNDKQEIISYNVFFHLYDSLDIEIASANYKIPNITDKLSVEFSFAPQSDSLNKEYYLLIQTDAPEGQLSVWTSFYDSYENGEAYLNENALSYDLAFETYYKPSFTSWITYTLNYSKSRLLRLFLITLLFLSLGFSICFLFDCLTEDLIQNIIYSLAVGVAIPPLLLLVMSIIRVNINKVNVFYVLIILGVIAGLKLLAKDKTSKPHVIKITKIEATALTVLFILAAFTRVSQINDIVVPSWIDAIVHQQFISKILERQFISFGTIYPKGFHSNVIFEYLLFNESPAESTLMIGQWLSLMSGVTFYLLARKLLRTPYSLLAVGIYWFWVPFPSFLINWGRYPYLQSLVLLPAVVHIFSNNALNRFAKIILLTMLLIGLGLTYYGTVLIFLLYVIIHLIHSISKDRYHEVLNKMTSIILPMVPIAIILLFRINHAFDIGIYGQDSTISLFEDSIQAFKISVTHGGWLIWILAVLGFTLALIFDYQKFLIMAEWFLVLLSFNLISATLGITISSIANSIIFLSIPLTLLSAFAIKFLLFTINMRVRALLVYTIITIFALSGAYNISGIIQPSYVLYLQADQDAMEWIDEHTSPDSVFLVNSFQWGNDLAAADGGGWLTMFTNRKSILYDPNSFESSFENEEIDYIYLGKGYGAINSEYLVDNGRFILVYNIEGVKIFKRLQ